MHNKSPLSTKTLEQLFTEARTFSAWEQKTIDPNVLTELYDLVKFGPTSANCSPMRLLFLVSDEAKARLIPTLSKANRSKSQTAGAVAIIAYDTEFYEELPRLFPHADAKSWFTGSPELAQQTAFRNSSLQGGYLILAARALGLDCGPMSGFDAEALNAEFFPDGKYKVNFICNLGYGKADTLHPRLPRLEFDDVAKIL